MPGTLPDVSGCAVGEPTLQTGFILFPRDTIHPGCSLPLQRVKAVPQQIDRHVVEQSSKPLLLPFLCCLTHTAPSLVTLVSRSASGSCSCSTDRCFPWSAPFPPPSPLKIAPLCSTDSQVLWRSPTPLKRACPLYGVKPFRTGLDSGGPRRFRGLPVLVHVVS